MVFTMKIKFGGILTIIFVISASKYIGIGSLELIGGAGESYENTMYAFKRWVFYFPHAHMLYNFLTSNKELVCIEINGEQEISSGWLLFFVVITLPTVVAVAIGTEMLELDCHLTKDGQVVVSHDYNLLRSTGTNKNISDLDYKELPLLKHRLPIDFDPDVEYVGSENEDERQFALLKEVFKAFPHIPINIDIKINNDELISKVAALIKEYNREDYTVWGNFSDEITKKCYKTNPNVNLLFSMQRVTMLIILMYTGLLPFVPLKETHLEIFLPSIYLRRKGGPIRTFPSLEKLMVRTMNILLMRPCLFNHLRARGIHVYFWVLNKDEEFKHAFDLGATGVMTDYPSRLKSFLKNNALD